ncbi:phage portal protein [Vibrio sp. V42_P2S4T144]|uniref:phage portal protein n=1 Tax=Vibrio sp. V42_P2S4T144 TaxID=1938693 RepID=UPI001372F92F|nr:phage portal protein [Vibrio sp. V42_P2S4T144]
MNVFRWATNLFGGKSTEVSTGGQINFPDHYLSTPAPVNEDTALQLPTVMRCITLTANMIGSAPLSFTEEINGARKKSDHIVWDLIQNKPNPYMSGTTFRQTLALNLMLHGNFYARIARNSIGEPVALFVMPSQDTTPELQANGELIYRQQLDPLIEGTHEKLHKAEDVFHIKGMGNGLTGLSPLAYHRSTLGIAITQDKFQSDYFSSGGRPGGILSTEQILTDEQRKKIDQRLIAQMETATSSHKTMILEGGFKYQSIALSPQDMATLESRKYTTEDIARIYGVPLSLLGIGELTNKSLPTEDVIRSWISTDLGILFTKIEDEIRLKLMTRKERTKYNVEFESFKLLRHDFKTLSGIGTAAVTAGILTQNEARELMNKPPKEGEEYDTLRQQAQLVSAQSSNTNEGTPNGD